MRFAPGNEGDYDDGAGVEGGSRGFTLFSSDGQASSTSRARASSTRSCAPATSRRPARRTRATSPRASRSSTLGGRTLLFVGSERAERRRRLRRRPRRAAASCTSSPPASARRASARSRSAGCWPSPPRPTARRRASTIRSLVTLYKLRSRRRRSTRTSRAPNETRGPADPVGARSPACPATPTKPGTAVGGQRLVPRAGVHLRDRRSTHHAGDDRAADPESAASDVDDQANGRLRPRGHRRPAARAASGSPARAARTRAARGRTCSCARTRPGTVLETRPAARERSPAGATSSGFEGLTVTGSAVEGRRDRLRGHPAPVGGTTRGWHDEARPLRGGPRGPLHVCPLPAGARGVAALLLRRPVGDHAAARRADGGRSSSATTGFAEFQARIKRIYGVDLLESG